MFDRSTEEGGMGETLGAPWPISLVYLVNLGQGEKSLLKIGSL